MAELDRNPDLEPIPPVVDTKPDLEVVESTTTPTIGETRVEEFSINGDSLVSKVKELIQEGNARRIIIKNQEGHTLIEIPLTVGVVGGAIGVLAFPVTAALGAIGAMVARLTLVVEKKVD
ncbi:DUF4342 domain-containing protein [Oscillatoria sp. FACHB-1406]|uniref:DUF4342 domain-containing protein n=1 Tax=Oscillatoria sp. FACHB-1406 TaxID=2692846 RepID=UPI00168859AB|nr:DUF4342 domain-containing protein [Oscillatoria sp. FACHB-1406]MBD2578433.1 DUF4342 domain-containing protein [Oscillatoria sp. FACHB-1406]